jgi:hypothetical protein
MKTHVLLVRRTFPKGHKRAKEETYFVEKILSELIPCGLIDNTEVKRLNINLEVFNKCDSKLHTCRKNYEFWEKKIKEVQEDKAVLSLRYWKNPKGRSLKGNKQIEFARLDRYSGVGIQELKDINNEGILINSCVGLNFRYDINLVAEKDGLTLDDFKDWFKNYDLSEPLAIIWFVNKRY